MLSFELNERYLRELLIHFFNWKKSAAEAHQLLVETYGEAALSARLKVYEDAKLEALLDQDSCKTQEEQCDGQYFK